MFGLSSIGRQAASGAPALTVADAISQVAAGELIVIDVREVGEVAASGKAKGALHVPLMMVPTHCDTRHPECRDGLATDKPVAVYCASGARSSQAARVLRQLGYENVHNLGGFGDWVRSGGAIEK